MKGNEVKWLKDEGSLAKLVIRQRRLIISFSRNYLLIKSRFQMVFLKFEGLQSPFLASSQYKLPMISISKCFMEQFCLSRGYVFVTCSVYTEERYR